MISPGRVLVLLGLSTLVFTAPTQIGSGFKSELGQPCTATGEGLCQKKECPVGEAWFSQSALACICPSAANKAVRVIETCNSLRR